MKYRVELTAFGIYVVDAESEEEAEEVAREVFQHEGPDDLDVESIEEVTA